MSAMARKQTFRQGCRGYRQAPRNLETRMTELHRMPPVVRDYVDAFNSGDFARLVGLFTPDAVVFGVLGSAPIAKAEAVWRELHEGMAMHLAPEAVAVDGVTVAVRYRETGRFQGTFRGLAGVLPTGRAYQVIAMEWFELDEGRIAKRWGARDFDAIKKQVLADS
jgi:predicted ester cyclase